MSNLSLLWHTSRENVKKIQMGCRLARTATTQNITCMGKSKDKYQKTDHTLQMGIPGWLRVSIYRTSPSITRSSWHLKFDWTWCKLYFHRPSPTQHRTPKNSRSSGFRKAGSHETMASRSFPKACSRSFMKVLSFMNDANNFFQ
mmetsp:Transcript_122542/g.192246  ORF Transcript_122542/g.192246 Transcript_122542/m.192246 type:complete len:144 (-) Transcript_122542:330-761(-)